MTDHALNLSAVIDSPPVAVRLWHIYERVPARMGDVALCGHVKEEPTTALAFGGPECCVVCGDLWKVRYA